MLKYFTYNIIFTAIHASVLPELEINWLHHSLLWVALGLLLIFIVLRFKEKKQKEKLQNLLIQQQLEFQTHQKNIEQQNKMLLHVNEEKDNFINILTHNLKTPISQVVGLADILKVDLPHISREQAEYLSLIQDTAMRMDKMITNLLCIEAIEAKKSNINIEPVNLIPVLQNIIRQFDVLTQRKDISLTLNTRSHDYKAQVDANYYTQIIENLISNAIKFSPAHATIVIDIYDEQNRIVTCVRDHGPGISKEDQKKLFRKFQKLSAKPTGGEASTGLGLSIVQKFTEVMNGEVSVDSKLNQGTTVSVKFEKVKPILQTSF